MDTLSFAEPQSQPALASSEASILRLVSVFWYSTELILALKSTLASSMRMNGIGSIVRIGTCKSCVSYTAGTAAWPSTLLAGSAGTFLKPTSLMKLTLDIAACA